MQLPWGKVASTSLCSLYHDDTLHLIYHSQKIIIRCNVEMAVFDNNTSIAFAAIYAVAAGED